MVMSSSLAGEEMMTFLAPASRWALALGPVRKMPVDSTTTSTPSAPQGISLGSRMAKFLTSQPPKTMTSSLTVTSKGCAAVVGVVAQQVRVGRDVEEVVDGHHFHGLGLVFSHGLEELASDASESVDAYLELGHAGCLLNPRRCGIRTR
jgi:hypothetical protein